MGVWWGGAEARASSNFPNTGVRAVINVAPQSTGSNVLAVWVAEAMLNGPTGHRWWAQVGYYFVGTVPAAFVQLWDLDTNSVLPSGGNAMTVTVGSHEFSLYVQSGTTWAFALDGLAFYTYDMGATGAYSGYAIQNLVEEQAATGFTFNTINSSVCFSVRQSGVWQPVQTATAYASPYYGTQGKNQNAALPVDSINVGSSIPLINTGAVLWQASAPGPTATSLTLTAKKL